MFDFRKAFDLVSHKKLILKLSAYGIRGNLLQLIEDFLSNRTQVTKVGFARSNLAAITSGVIQGSCLGPLLFILYINDLPSEIRPPTKLKLFADDLKIFDSITSLFSELNIQRNVYKVDLWSDVCDLPLSIEKCSILHLCTRSKSSSRSPPAYFIKNTRLLTNSTVKDLAIIIDSQLNFNEHINTVVKKASSRASLIFKCFLSHNLQNLLKAYVVYVRPLVEYCSPVWSPHCKKYVLTIESVQRSFTKRLPGLRNLNYPQRLERLKLKSLELRRLKADLI